MTPHFTLEEALITNSGLPNIPTEEQKARILHTAHQMEIVRAVLNRKPIGVNSWFRSDPVNLYVGGSATSEHKDGAAVDFTCPSFGNPLEICRALLSVAWIVNYNQLIYEGTWVHISFPPDGVKGKLEVLTKVSGGYRRGLPL